MQTSISFLTQTISSSSYLCYDADGVPSTQPSHLINYSLLPIVSQGAQVADGGTLWVLSTDENDIKKQLNEACARGARVIICAPEHQSYIDELSLGQRAHLEVVLVPQPAEALVVAARAWRAQCMLPIVGITGSVGKTTTKHMLATIFTTDNLPVFVSSGDQRSEAGIALNILHITDKHVTAIFELGVDAAGAMKKLVDLLQPTLGVITSVSAAHLRGLGSVNEVAAEKRSIFSQFSPSQIGIICGDYPLLTSCAYQHPVVRFGLKYKNLVTAKQVTVFTQPDGSLATRCVLKVYDHEQEIILPGNHIGTVYAALAASAVCYFLHTPFTAIIAGLQAFIPVSRRFEMRELRGGRGTVVDDAYTANPESVKAALHAVHSMASPQKIAVLGDMADLGTKQYFWHRHVGRELIKTRSISQLVLVGQLARAIGPVAPATMDVSCVDDWQQAHEELDRLMAPRDNLVLVKGSRSVGLSHLVDRLVES